MDFPGRKRRFRRAGLVVFLLCLLVSVSSAQETDTAAIDFEPERVVKGNRFTIQIRTSIPWGEEVTISRPQLDGPMVWWAYPYARSWTAEAEDGSTVRLIEVLASIRVDAPGFHTIESFGVSAGGRTAVTEVREIIGLEPDESGLPYPVFVDWRNPPERVWQGQAVPLILEARNLASLSLADAVNLGSAPHGLLEAAPGMGGIVTRPYRNEILYDVPMASWIWTQVETGTYRFPDVQSDISGMKRAAPGFSVEVVPVPEVALASGAVGRFRVDYDIEAGPHHVGDVVSLRVRVEGEGNMNVLNPPVPEMDGAGLVGQGSSSSYIPGPSGYEGWREERYDFQVERSGSLSYTIPGWVWFEPSGEGRIRRSTPETGYLTVEKALGEVGDDDTLRLLGEDIFRYPSAEFHWKNSYWLLLTLPGFIILVIVFLLKRPGSKTIASMIVLPLLLSASSIDASLSFRAASAAEAGEDGDWLTAESEYLSILEETGEFPGLLHDLSIVEMELNRPDLAVAYMRNANHLRPGSAVMMDALTRVERHLGLFEQMPLPLRFPPGIIFLILLVSINLAFLAVVLLLYRRDARSIIMTLSIIILLAASLTATMLVSRLWSEENGVVRVAADPLRKIPGPLATDWIQLPAGTAVSVVAEEGADYLVRTGFGLEGWLPGESLILTGGDSDGF